jgi:hypothetical protein
MAGTFTEWKAPLKPNLVKCRLIWKAFIYGLWELSLRFEVSSGMFNTLLGTLRNPNFSCKIKWTIPRAVPSDLGITKCGRSWWQWSWFAFHYYWGSWHSIEFLIQFIISDLEGPDSKDTCQPLSFTLRSSRAEGDVRELLSYLGWTDGHCHELPPLTPCVRVCLLLVSLSSVIRDLHSFNEDFT